MYNFHDSVQDMGDTLQTCSNFRPPALPDWLYVCNGAWSRCVAYTIILAESKHLMY